MPTPRVTCTGKAKPLVINDQGECQEWSCRDLNPGPSLLRQGFSVRSSRMILTRPSDSHEHVSEDGPSRQ